MEQLVNGRFEYEVPPLMVTEKEISLTVREGEQYRGEIHAGTADGRSVKGMISTDHPRILLLKDRFSGSACTIVYAVNTTGLKGGSRIDANIILSSSLGEKKIPLHVSIEKSRIKSTKGVLENLEDFTKLAARDYREAFSFFTKKTFYELLREEDAYRYALYQGMSRNPVTYQHLEEFLAAAGQKEKIRLTIEETEKVYTGLAGNVKDTLYIYKNTWGYVRMEIEVQGDFLEVSRQTVTTENFIGSVYGLDYIIHRDKLGKGKHFGKIIIRSVHQTLEFSIEASSSEKAVRRKKPEVSRHIAELAKEQLAYLTDKMDELRWYDSAWNHVRMLRAAGEKGTWLAFLRIFLHEKHHENALAMELLWEIENGKYPVETARERALLLYYQKKLSMISPEHRSIVPELTGFCRHEPGDFVLAYLMIQEDDAYRLSAARQMYALESVYNAGCTSPFLYLMAYRVLEEQEVQLRRLSPFMLRILLFAQKQQILTESLLKRAAYLSSHLKSFDKHVYRLLAEGYEQYPSDEVLEAICHLIMKGQPANKAYFRWYALAVEKKLKITRLYEYYIETMSADFEGVLPQVIRMYFSYNNRLSGSKKAFVYANVIRNRENDKNTWLKYKKGMEDFARQEVQKGRINEDYALLYREFLPMPQDQSSARAMTNVLFTHEIVCENRKIRRIIVCHPALQRETTYPVTDKKTYVRICGEQAEIFLEDEKKRRFASTIAYEDRVLFDNEVLAHACGAYEVDDPGLLLYLCGETEEQMHITEAKLSLYLQAAESKAFTERYRRLIRKKLLEFFWEHPGELAVVDALGEMDDRAYAAVNKASTVELLTADAQYARAFALLTEYGYEEVSDTCLLRIASHMILQHEFQETEELLELAAYIFRNGMYDEVILRYLVQYYRGSVEEMCALWEKVKGFQVESYRLDERLLTTVMFVRAWPEQGCRIFESYLSQTGKELVVTAYLTYLSIGNFMENREVDEQIFACLESIYKRGWEMDEICFLALLKYYAGKTNLSEEQTEIVEKLLYRFQQEGLRFAFYQKLPPQLTQMYQVDDRVFIEEKFPANSQVMIHYRLPGMEEWKSEPMKNMYQGIFVREFLLFYGEKLDYYLTCEKAGKTTKSEMRSIYMTEIQDEGKSRYQMLNRILAARTMGSQEETKKALRNYLEKESLVKTCFSLME